MSILNTAQMRKFSCDRSIQDYCRDIWHADPVQIEFKEYIQTNADLKVEQ